MFARGIYAITPSGWERHKLLEALEGILKSGVSVIQYRDKNRAFSEKLAIAQEIISLCRTFGVPSIINDDVALAMKVKADGVHLGRDDVGLQQVRKEWGSTKIVGLSCYGDLERAHYAKKEGASYVAFGSIYQSTTKVNAIPIGVHRLGELTTNASLPVVAIGGINASNVREVYEAGVYAVAVISALFVGESPVNEVQKMKIK